MLKVKKIKGNRFLSKGSSVTLDRAFEMVLIEFLCTSCAT